MNRLKPIIIGFDPGVTTAYAAIDFDGNLIISDSKRDFGLSAVREAIIKLGKPMIVAVDKASIPSSAEKLAAGFGCKVFNPEKDLAVEEKDDLIKSLRSSSGFKNDHEKDAAASAMYAYRSLQSKFSRVDAAVKMFGIENKADDIKEMLMVKRAKNIAEAIQILMSKPEEVKTDIKIVQEKIDPKILEIQSKLKRLQNSYDILKMYSTKIEEKANKMEKQLEEKRREENLKDENVRKKIMEEKEIKSRDILIKQLEYELRKYKSYTESIENKIEKNREFKELKEQGYIPFVMIEDFNKEDIMDAHKEFGLKNNAIWIKNEAKFSKAPVKLLESLQPKIILGKFDNKTIDALNEVGITVVTDVNPEIFTVFAGVLEDELENALKKNEKKNFLQWVSKYRKRL